MAKWQDLIYLDGESTGMFLHFRNEMFITTKLKLKNKTFSFIFGTGI